MLYETSENLQATQHQLTFLSLKHTPYRKKLFYYACVLLSKILSTHKSIDLEKYSYNADLYHYQQLCSSEMLHSNTEALNFLSSA